MLRNGSGILFHVALIETVRKTALVSLWKLTRNDGREMPRQPGLRFDFILVGQRSRSVPKLLCHCTESETVGTSGVASQNGGHGVAVVYWPSFLSCTTQFTAQISQGEGQAASYFSPPPPPPPPPPPLPSSPPLYISISISLEDLSRFPFSLRGVCRFIDSIARASLFCAFSIRFAHLRSYRVWWILIHRLDCVQLLAFVLFCFIGVVDDLRLIQWDGFGLSQCDRLPSRLLIPLSRVCVLYRLKFESFNPAD